MPVLRVEFNPIGAIRTASAVRTSAERMRKFCRETDAKYGDMNNMYRDAITDLKQVHRSILAALREAGWPMEDEDIEDDPIDKKI